MLKFATHKRRMGIANQQGIRGYRLDFTDPVGRICRAIPVEGIGWRCVAEIKSRVLPSQLLVKRQGLQELLLVLIEHRSCVPARYIGHLSEARATMGIFVISDGMSVVSPHKN